VRLKLRTLLLRPSLDVDVDVVDADGSDADGVGSADVADSDGCIVDSDGVCGTGMDGSATTDGIDIRIGIDNDIDVAAEVAVDCETGSVPVPLSGDVAEDGDGDDIGGGVEGRG